MQGGHDRRQINQENLLAETAGVYQAGRPAVLKASYGKGSFYYVSTFVWYGCKSGEEMGAGRLLAALGERCNLKSVAISEEDIFCQRLDDGKESLIFAFYYGKPEEWLASITQAVNPGFPSVENEGLSAVSAGDKSCLLKELIERAPQEMLGRKHFNRYGAKTGVLVKLLDPAVRLSIQVHPDKTFAKKYFHSEYGKTECWHILDVREIDGQKPYLLMGFAPGVTEEAAV